MSYVLRHAPEEINLELNTEGWAETDQLLLKMNARGYDIDKETLIEVVAQNAKKRFAFNDDKSMIRANQGHSIQIDHGFEAVMPPDILYHGTATKSVDSILKSGIEKRGRHHVHLSADIDTAKQVGQRHGKVVILEVLALEMHQSGHVFYLSENKVWLTDSVPTQYLRIRD